MKVLTCALFHGAYHRHEILNSGGDYRNYCTKCGWSQRYYGDYIYA